MDREIENYNRLSKLSESFGQVSERVYLIRNHELPTKIKGYLAIVIFILLHVSETWTLYSKQLKLLNTFHLWCLGRIFHIM